MPGSDNVLIMDFWENYTIPASNQSSVHWRLRLQVNFGVNAIQIGQVFLTDANGEQALVWNYTGNPGYFTAGNTYTLAEGDYNLRHNAAGAGVLAAWGSLRTSQQGSSWSFNKTASRTINATPITRTPSAPRNLRTMSIGRTWVQLVADEPTDWGNQRGTFVWRSGMSNPPSSGTYWETETNGNIGVLPPGDLLMYPNEVYYAQVFAKNPAGFSPSSEVIAFRTLPEGPAYPVDLVVTKTGTALTPVHHLTWTNRSTFSAPYYQIEIRREEWGSNGWNPQVIVATLDGTATSADILATTFNRAYRYRVRVSNPSGWASSAAESTAPTWPLSLLTVRAERGQGGSAVITWDYPAEALSRMHSLQVIVQEQVGGTWVQKAAISAVQSPVPRSWTDTSPSGGSVTYRVFLRAQQGWTTTSAFPYLWTSDGPYSTASLTIEAEPGPPSRLWPASVPVDLARDQAFTWQYNSRDGSPQTYYQVRYRLVGATDWTMGVQTASAESVWPYQAGTLDNGQSYQWQVRTMGACVTCGWSEWSETATFVGSYTPVVSIDSPEDGSVQSLASLTVTWGYYDADGQPQIRWWSTLYEEIDGVLYWVEGLSGSGTATQASFQTVIKDGSTYVVEVAVEDSSGLRSDTAQSRFTVQYDPPGVVILSAVWDYASATVGLTMTPTMSDDGTDDPPTGSLTPDGAVLVDGEIEDDDAVLIEADGEADDGAVLVDLDDSVEEPIAVDVWRQIDDGPWVLLAEQISPSSSLTDLYPSMNGCNRYRLVVWSALPSTRVQDPAATVCVGPNQAAAGVGGIVHQSPEGILSYGQTPDDQLRLCGVATSETMERDQDSVWVDGAEDPVWLGGTTIEQTYSLDGTTTQGRQPVDAAVRTDAPLVWRDITGQRVQVSIVSGLSKKWLRPDYKNYIEVKGNLLRVGTGDDI